jgi:hypothetical protein
LVSELGILSNAENNANSHVLGSVKASIILLQNKSERTRWVRTTVHQQNTNCSFLNPLFSTPVWFSLILSTALMRSSGVKNHAVVGESGKRNLRSYDITYQQRLRTQNRRCYQKAVAVMSVMVPVIIISHCHGWNRPVWIWSDPYEMNARTIWAFTIA